MIDEPPVGRHTGGAAAAPVFSAVMAEALRALGVPPDAPVDNVTLPPSDAQEIREEV
jgi:cell division protein FtsI (penicillin-binding protein 3)